LVAGVNCINASIMLGIDTRKVRITGFKAKYFFQKPSHKLR